MKSSSAIATTSTAELASGDLPGAVGPGRGRFAPSPSGRLHFGSLVAAAGSYLDARSRGADWILRIEDLDTPRTREGAEAQILADLARFGFEWQGPVVRQSERAAHYEQALVRLESAGLVYPCHCSRSQLAAWPDAGTAAAGASGEEAFHPPQCVGAPRPGVAPALRFRVPDRLVEFQDRAQGRLRAHPAREVGDFVVRRRDGIHAYQLAVVVDDALQGITDVVRGADLCQSTPRQILLQGALGLPTPSYLHLPLAVREDGTKLSKSGDAPALAAADPVRQLWLALSFLRQEPPGELMRGQPRDLWCWALENWAPERFAGIRQQRVPEP